MSDCPTGSEVGIAWLGTLCQVNATNTGSSFVSGTGVSTAGLTEWQIISHEMGHNFGAIVRLRLFLMAMFPLMKARMTIFYFLLKQHDVRIVSNHPRFTIVDTQGSVVCRWMQQYQSMLPANHQYLRC